LILELMPLGSLSYYIKNSKGKMSWKERHQMMTDICEGMAFLHADVNQKGTTKKVVFHQDLKTGNILLSNEDGQLRGKIADFGLSCNLFFY
jgi:serine/threonine protein kinase